MNTIIYSEVVAMTDKEKLKMYMKLSKKEIAKMLIESNKSLEMIINLNRFTFPVYPVYPDPINPMYPIITYDTNN